MVVYKNKNFVTNSKYPDSDFMGNADFVIPDGSELAEKIKNYENFDFVLDEAGNLVDVVETERPPVPPAITQEQRLTAAENAIEEIINLIMEG